MRRCWGTGAERTVGFGAWMKRKPRVRSREHRRHLMMVALSLLALKGPSLGSKLGAGNGDLGVPEQEVEVDHVRVNEI